MYLAAECSGRCPGGREAWFGPGSGKGIMVMAGHTVIVTGANHGIGAIP